MSGHEPLPSKEQEALSALERRLQALQSQHMTLGIAYRAACEELERLRKEREDHRARLHAVRLLCTEAAP